MRESAADIPLPWESVLWRGRPLSPIRRARGERYVLTDLRLAIVAGNRVQELALGDIDEIVRTESAIERAAGVATLSIGTRRGRSTPLCLASIRRSSQLAALLELLSGDPNAAADPDALRAALRWTPRPPAGGFHGAIASMVAMVLSIAAAATLMSLSPHAAPVALAADDAIAPNGTHRSRAEIASFMQREVMPWAAAVFSRMPGGPVRVTCETCHGVHPETHDWTMPAVPALPRADLRASGWEIYNRRLDAQIRNAIYGYVADADRQPRAAYMREVVVPGIAELLHRPAYDFTKSYDFNRTRHAIGCYHCHRVT